MQSSPWLESDVALGGAAVWPSSIVPESATQDTSSIALYNSKGQVPAHIETNSQKNSASAPPGFEMNSSIKAGSTVAQSQRQPRRDGTGNQSQHQHSNQHHYVQSTGNPNRGVQMSAGEMGIGIPLAPYPYAAPGFDGMAPPQFPQQHMYAAAPINTAGVGGNPSSSTSSAPQQYQATPPGMAASYPFSANPYYAGQYFYPGAQAPFYYSQPGGRGLYPPAQYPGAPQGGYPDIYGTAGMGMGSQYSDAGPYGGIPVHQVPIVGTPTQPAHPSAGPKSAKGIGTAGSSTTSGTAPTQVAGTSQGSANNDVSHQFGNTYGYPREGWMIPQHGWAAMMPFGATPTYPSPGNFAPPSSMPQSGRPEGNSRSNSSALRNGPANASNGAGWSS